MILGPSPQGLSIADPAHANASRQCIKKTHSPSPQGLSVEDPAHANAFTLIHNKKNNYINRNVYPTNHQIRDNRWFITFTCYDWSPLFEITKSYDLIYNWLKPADEKYKIKTLAFVLMPNHVHLLLYLTDESVNLNTIISNAKRFMAYSIVERLTLQNQNAILDKLSSACSEKEKRKGQKHKVFEPSFDAKVVYSLDFLYQKIDYIHYNPVRGKWNLAKEYTDYEHSTAAFYEVESSHSFVDITDYRQYWF